MIFLHVIILCIFVYPLSKLIDMGLLGNITNSNIRKESEKRFQEAIDRYENQSADLTKKVEHLYKTRKNALTHIDKAEAVLQESSFSTVDILEDIADKKKDISFFREATKLEEFHENKDSSSAKAVMSAGAALGTAIATLGPGAAMAFATTFGTAATGTAISALSGAAATNAALAFLGGGAIAAGGAGVAGGSLLLAAIPIVGWTIGGAAIIGGGFALSKKNKKIAQEYNEKVDAINNVIDNINVAANKIEHLDSNICKKYKELNELVRNISDENVANQIKDLILLLCDKITEQLDLKFDENGAGI